MFALLPTIVRAPLTRLAQKSLVKNVVVVSTGTAGAQAITMAISPVITRLYGPESFGLLGTFVAIIAVLTPIAALTYPMAIVLPQKDKDARKIARLSIAVGLGTALLAFLLLLLASEPLITVLKLDNVAPFLFFIPVVMLFATILQVTEQWLIRCGKFRATAQAGVIQSLFLNGSKVFAGLMMPLGGSLILVTVLGSLFHAWILSFVAKEKKVKLNIFSEAWRVKDLGIVAAKYKDFGLYQTPQAFMNAISQSIPILMLASLFGPVAAGFYTLAKSVLGIPSSLIGKSVGDVFYPRISNARSKNEDIFPLVSKATIALAAIGIVPFSIVVIWGPWLFSIAFGGEWSVAGEYSQWIALWLYTAFLNPPSVKAVMVLGKQKSALVINLCTLPLRALGLYCGYRFYESEVMAIALYCLAGIGHNLVFIIYTLFVARKGADCARN